MADLGAAGSRVRAALEDMFGAVAEIGAAFAAQRRGCRAAGAVLTPDRLSGLREVIWHQLGLLPGADGAGVVTAPGVIMGKQRHLEWWQRTPAADDGQDGFARIRLNLDSESIDLYDYLDMDWFTVPRKLGRRYVYGPYVDFSGADRYVLTLTIPVFADGVPGAAARARGEGDGAPGEAKEATGGRPDAADEREFLGIAGTDIRMSHLEPSCSPYCARFLSPPCWSPASAGWWSRTRRAGSPVPGSASCPRRATAPSPRSPRSARTAAGCSRPPPGKPTRFTAAASGGRSPLANSRPLPSCDHRVTS